MISISAALSAAEFWEKRSDLFSQNGTVTSAAVCAADCAAD